MLKFTQYPITSGYGVIDNVHPEPHSGVDFATPEGTPVHAPADGRVIEVKWYDSVGNTVIIELDGGETLSFCHLSEIKVKEGQLVRKGKLLAYTGNTGYKTTGPHLHVTMRKEGQLVDPLPYLTGELDFASSGVSMFTLPILIVLVFVFWRLKKPIFYGFLGTIGIVILFLIGLVVS